jgi:hypothetical protein
MTHAGTSRYVLLHAQLVLHIADTDRLRAAALDHIDGDEFMPVAERGHARASVRDDEAEALAYLVDPFDLVSGVPGIELAQASWSSEQIDYDPRTEDYHDADFDLDDDDDETSETGESDGGERRDRLDGHRGRDTNGG